MQRYIFQEAVACINGCRAPQSPSQNRQSGPPIIIIKVAATSQNVDPEYCLLWENGIQFERIAQISAFCTFRGAHTHDAPCVAGPAGVLTTPLTRRHCNALGQRLRVASHFAGKPDKFNQLNRKDWNNILKCSIPVVNTRTESSNAKQLSISPTEHKHRISCTQNRHRPLP